jgi:hypothetical protein
MRVALTVELNGELLPVDKDAHREKTAAYEQAHDSSKFSHGAIALEVVAAEARGVEIVIPVGAATAPGLGMVDGLG